MTLVQGIVSFILIWWTFLFCVLPFGNAPSETPIAGETGNIPATPRIFKKFLITTALSVVIWLVINGLIALNVIDFYGMAHDMEIKDGLK